MAPEMAPENEPAEQAETAFKMCACDVRFADKHDNDMGEDISAKNEGDVRYESQ